MAPAFLLSAMGMLLNLFATRLARVVDRARWIEAEFATRDRTLSVGELRILDRRMRIMQAAIGLCTGGAIAVCLVVAGLFLFSLAGAGFEAIVATLFVLAMAMLVSALVLFLYEVRLAGRAIRIRNELLERR